MAVKLDVTLNWISNLQTLERNILSMNKRIARISRAFFPDYNNLLPLDKLKANNKGLEKYNELFNDLFSKFEKINKTGGLANLFYNTFGYKPSGDKQKGILDPTELTQFTSVKAQEELERRAKETAQKEKDLKNFEKVKKKSWQDIFMDTVKGQTSRNPIFDQMKKFYIQQDKNAKEEMRMMQHEKYAEQVAWEENRKFDEKKRIQERRNQEAEARKIMGEEKWNKKMNILHSRALEENKKRDEALRKKQLMMMLGKWGKFGVWGLVAQQAIKYISKAVGYAYSTSMQGLDWQRTIRGGASGGSWFGQGLAGYQRAGIGANQYQGFKRGIQGYLGSVKLGMGNAAPLMYLGLSALGKPDELERQLEQSLRRLPKDVSLALAGQMGLDYNMWETIYSGRLDRQKSAYSEEAIRKWSNLADSLNDLITSFKTFWFNNLAPVADFSSKFINNVVSKESGWLQTLNLANAWVNPAYALGSTAGKMLRMKIDEIVVTLKDSNGNVIEKTTTQAMTDGFMEVPQ